MKLTFTFLFLSLAVLACITVSPAFADTIAVQNASFETTNALFTYAPGNLYNYGPIPDWISAGPGPAGSWHPPANYPVPDGSFVAYSNGGTISQTLAVSLMPDLTYDLAVDIGHRPDGLVANYGIALYAGNTLLQSIGGSNGSIPAGTFADESLSYKSGFAPPSGNLRIVLSSSGPQINFDNVRLNTVPEPASLTLLAAGLGLILFVFRRR